MDHRERFEGFAAGFFKERKAWQMDSRSTAVRVGLVSTEPIRTMGLSSAFDNHTSILVATGLLDTLLDDRSLHFLILDLSFDPKWFEMQCMVCRMRPDMRVIVIGPQGSEDMIHRSICAGARAFLDPSAGPLALRQAVEAVVQGTIWAPRRVLSAIVDQLLRQLAAPIAPIAPHAAPAFSPRERQVLNLIMSACSNREIAAELGIEERTVKAYVTSLMRKVGVDNRVSLSMRAMQDAAKDQRSLPS